MKALFAVIAMSFAACASVDSEMPEPEPVDPGPGSDDPTPPEHSAAHDYFDTTVYPMLVGSCGNCHMGAPGSGGFLTSDATQAYETIKTSSVVGDFTPNAPIAKLSQLHQVEYRPADLAIVLEWLRLEREGL